MAVDAAGEHFLELFWREQVTVIDYDIEIKIKTDVRCRIHGDHVSGCAADQLVLECEFLPKVILDVMEQMDDFIAEWRPLIFRNILEMVHKKPSFLSQAAQLDIPDHYSIGRKGTEVNKKYGIIERF